MRILNDGGMAMRKTMGLLTVLISLAVAQHAVADDFTLAFEWGDIPLCTSGNPNTVPNPTFTLTNVPEGTKFLSFTLTDLDVASYNHGGGTIEYTGENVIAPGAFKYKSPCPPGGSHEYEWTVKAKESDGFFSGSIASASASVSYP